MKGRGKAKSSQNTGLGAGERMVIGRNAVEAVLNVRSEDVHKLFVAADEKGRAGRLMNLATEHGIAIVYCSKGELTQRSGSESHQGFLANVKARPLGTRQELVARLREQDKFLVVALDGVSDPHNVGAILRACECFGVDAVIWSKNRSPGITPAVTKVAVGATELLSLYEVSNLADTLLAIEKEAGADVVCADGDVSAIELDKFTPPSRCVLVLGSEGDGVADLVKRRAHALVKIPMSGEIDSLNVSQAAAVFLSVFAKQSL